MYDMYICPLCGGEYEEELNDGICDECLEYENKL